MNNYSQSLKTYLEKKQRTQINFFLLLLYFFLSVIVPFVGFLISLGSEGVVVPWSALRSKGVLFFLVFYFLIYYLLVERVFPRKTIQAVLNLILLMVNGVVIWLFNTTYIASFFVKYVMTNMLIVTVVLIVLNLFYKKGIPTQISSPDDTKRQKRGTGWLFVLVYIIPSFVLFLYISKNFFQKVGVHADIFEICYYVVFVVYSVVTMLKTLGKRTETQYYDSTGRRGPHVMG